MNHQSNRRTYSDVPRDPYDRDRLREEWRLAALEWVRAEDIASRLEEGRRIVLDGMTLELVESGESVTRAEKAARTSDKFKTYIRKMHDARLAANELKIEKENLDRLYWALASQEANDRAERRMSR